MDAISSLNLSRARQTNPNQHRSGVDNEMIKIENAKLWFMGGHEHNQFVGIVKEGDFQIRMIIQKLSPALMTKCIVDTLEWPLTKDSPIIRVAKRSFVFAMPGLLYGLQLSPNCHEEIFDILEKIFMSFGWYKDYSVSENGRDIFGSDLDPYFWPTSQWSINCISQPLLKELGTYWKRDETPIYNINDRILRVQHMSFMVKLITKGLLIGKIDPTEHIVVAGKRWVTYDNGDDGDEIESRASPTIFLFSDLMEALEESKFLTYLQYDMIVPYDPHWTPVPNTKFWNINKTGLLMILPVIKSASNLKFEVNVNAVMGHAYNRFFVPLKIESDGNNDDGRVPRHEIRFSIMDEVGFCNKNKTTIEQPGMACDNIDLQIMK